MNAASVNGLALVIHAAMQTHTTAAGIAMAVEPAVVEPLRHRIAELEQQLAQAGEHGAQAFQRASLNGADSISLRGRVMELEQQLAVAQAPRVRPVPRPMRFDGVPDAVLEAALRTFVATHLDYDMHKNLEQPEDGRPDQYPALTRELAKALTLQAEAAGFEVEPWGGDDRG